MPEYNTGTPVRLTAQFKWDGNPADPTGVTLKLRGPVGFLTYVYGTAPGLIRDDVGIYHFDFTATAAGTYYYQWEGSGAVPVWKLATLRFVGKWVIT